MTTFTTKFMMAVLVFALITVAGLAQAKQPIENRFVVLPPGDWVLDTNTSLRWQQEPGSAIVVGDGASCNSGEKCYWQEATDYCAALGGGSRLPEVKEWVGMWVDYMDTIPADALNTPNGPFENVKSTTHWSATPNTLQPDKAWYVFFRNDFFVKSVRKTNNRQVWCVR